MSLPSASYTTICISSLEPPTSAAPVDVPGAVLKLPSQDQPEKLAGSEQIEIPIESPIVPVNLATAQSPAVNVCPSKSTSFLTRIPVPDIVAFNDDEPTPRTTRKVLP